MYDPDRNEPHHPLKEFCCHLLTQSFVLKIFYNLRNREAETCEQRQFYTDESVNRSKIYVSSCDQTFKKR